MLSQLSDWYDALHFAKPFIKGDLHLMIHDVVVEEGDTSSPWLAKMEYIHRVGPNQPAYVRFGVNIAQTLPKIERMEMNLCLISFALNRLKDGIWGDDAPMRLNYCKQFGCWDGMLNKPSDRWRLLSYHRSTDLMPISHLEDRPRCRICPGVVATGAGAWNNTRNGEPDEQSVYRPDVHHECLRYTHMVLAPALRARRAEEAAKRSAEVEQVSLPSDEVWAELNDRLEKLFGPRPEKQEELRDWKLLRYPYLYGDPQKAVERLRKMMTPLVLLLCLSACCPKPRVSQGFTYPVPEFTFVQCITGYQKYWAETRVDSVPVVQIKLAPAKCKEAK